MPDGKISAFYFAFRPTHAHRPLLYGPPFSFGFSPAHLSESAGKARRTFGPHPAGKM